MKELPVIYIYSDKGKYNRYLQLLLVDLYNNLNKCDITMFFNSPNVKYYSYKKINNDIKQ